MASVEETRKKLNEKYGSKPAKKTTQDIRNELNEKYVNVSEGFLKTFEADTASFFSTAQDDYNSMRDAYGLRDLDTGNDTYVSRIATLKDLRGRSARIRNYIDANKANLGEDSYNSIAEYLDSVDGNIKDVTASFKELRDYYSHDMDEIAGVDEYGDDYTWGDVYNSEKAQKERDALKENPDWLSKTNLIPSAEAAKRDADAIRREAFSDMAWNWEHAKQDGKTREEWEERMRKRHLLTLTYGVDFEEYNPGIWATNKDGSPAAADSLIAILDYAAESMNEEERQMLSYVYSTGGLDEARNYVQELYNEAKYKEAKDLAKQLEGKKILPLAFSAAAGVDQFFSGLVEETISDNFMEYASGMVREDYAKNGWVAGVAYDLAGVAGNMAPSILASTALGVINPTLGAAVGSGLMGLSAAGNASKQMLDAGYTKEQADKYGLMVGASEALLGFAFSGIGKLGGVATKAVIGNAVSGVESAIAKFAINYAGNIASEALEEATQTVLEPVFKAIATGENIEGVNWEEVAYSALLGGLSAGLFEGPGAAMSLPGAIVEDVTKQAKVKKVGADIINAQNVGALKTEASPFADDKSIAKALKKVEKKESAKNVGTLAATLQKVAVARSDEAAISELVAEGLSKDEAKKVVDFISEEKRGVKHSTDKKHVTMEEFANKDADIWRNIEYEDDASKVRIMQDTHSEMVKNGEVVKAADSTVAKVESAFPDLRGVKKKDRTPILREAMSKLKNEIRQFLNGFKNQSFEFEVNGKVLDAKLYNTGINEVLEKVTQEKANMLYTTEEIFKNARYLYSTPDYDGDPNVYRWNYFYTPVQIGEEIVGVRIAVRDVAKGTSNYASESQIYNWGIKKDASLDGGSRGPKVASSGVSSDTSIDTSLGGVGGDSVNRKSYGASSDASTSIVAEKTKDVKKGDSTSIAPKVLSDKPTQIQSLSKKYGRQAPAMVAAYSSGQDVSEYDSAFSAAYNMGREGVRFDYAMKSPATAYLNEVQREIAWLAGADSQSFGNLGRVNKETSEQTSKKTKKQGEIIYHTATKNTGDLQKTSLRAINFLAKTLGVNVHVFDSSDAKYKGKNGFYDPKDGSIWLDIHAGDKGEGTILFTAAHELTHFIKEWSDTKYEVFCDFLLDHYAEKGVDIDDLVAAQIEKAARHGETLTYDEAFDEVIADSCEKMLADGDAIAKIAELKAKDKDLWEKIKAFLSDLVDKIKAVYKDLSPDSAEGKFVAEQLDTFEELKRLWTEAVVEASENYAAATSVTETEQKNTAESGVKNSLRNEFSSELQEWFDITTHEERKVSGKRFLVGSTTDVLKSIGVKDYNIYFGGAKIDKILTNNTSMSLETIKSAVQLLEDPMLIMKSLTVEDSIVIFGEVYTNGGKPVMVSVLLHPETKTGDILDYAVITSAYGRRNNNVQNLINNSEIYYINENRKRTDTWLKALGLQLPSALTTYGSISSISENNTSVNRKNSLKNIDPKEMSAEERGLLAGLMAQGRTDARHARTLEERLEKTKARYRESRARIFEGRKKSELKGRIRKIKTDLEQALRHPTDRKYIPVGIGEAIIDICNLVNDDTDIYKSDGSINKAQAKREETKLKLEAIRDLYKALKNSDSFYAGDYDDAVEVYFEELVINYKDKPLSAMSLEELQGLYEILYSVKQTVLETRKLIGWNAATDVYEVGDAIGAEQAKIRKSRGKNGKRNVAQEAVDQAEYKSLSPVRIVEKMSAYDKDSYFVKVFSELERGVHKKDYFTMESVRMFEELSTGEKRQKYEDSIYLEDGGKKYTDDNGVKFGISKMEKMQAILSWEREQASKKTNHVQGGGLVFADVKMLGKGEIGKAVDAKNSHRVTNAEPLILSFIQELANDKWAQDYMDMARTFFNEKAKNAINETMMQIKHRPMATEQSYIPFEVDKGSIVREITSIDQLQQTINSYGMLKETQSGASQALIITGLNNIIDRHIEQVSQIYGLAVPIYNFNKMWNVKTESGLLVKGIIEENWGKEGTKVIEQAIQDLQGRRPSTMPKIMQKIRGNYISATFTLNLSVVTKQMASLFAAKSILESGNYVAMFLRTFYTMMPQNYKRLSSEVSKYTAAVWMRQQGLSDNELYTLSTEMKKSKMRRFFGKAPSFLKPSKWISGMDASVALTLWEYAKRDVKKRTGLKGEELMRATAEYFEYVIDNTQSMTDVLHRPEIQRSGGYGSEILGTFKTDLYQMSGLLTTNFGRFKANPSKENAKFVAKTVGSVLMSALWGNLMTSLFAALRYKVNPYRDDETDEITFWSWMQRVGMDFLTDSVGYILPLFGSEAVNLVRALVTGETAELEGALAIEAVNDVISAIRKVITSPDDSADAWIELAVTCLQALGLPAYNVERARKAIVLHFKDIINGEFLSFEAGLDKANGQRLYEAMISKDKERIKRAEAKFKDQSAINSAIRKALRENDPRITEAAEAYIDGDYAKVTKLVNKIASEGIFAYESIKAAYIAERDKIAKERGLIDKKSPEADSYEKEAIFDAKTYYDAIAVGNSTKIKTVREDILKYKTEEELQSSLRSVIKEKHAEGKVADNKATSMLTEYGGLTKEKAQSRVQYWNFQKKYPAYGKILSETAVSLYYNGRYDEEGELIQSSAEKNGIELDEYVMFVEESSGLNKEETLEIIDSMNLTKKQKDVLYYLKGWSERTIYDAPWH